MTQRVLVIDDQPLEGEMISFVLSRHRKDIEYVGQAINAASGIVLAEKTRADIVFLDIKMPGMDGITAISHLCGISPEISIIMLTAFDDFEYIRSAMRAGARDYLLKPVRPDDILDALDRCSVPRAFSPSAGISVTAAGVSSAAEDFKSAILSGDEDCAERAAEAYLQSFNGIDSTNFVLVCVNCMELASDILEARRETGDSGDGLNYLYQEFVKTVSNPKNKSALASSLKQFARRGAGMFGHTAGDVCFGQVSQAKRYVETHLHENITLSSVAKHLFLSPAYLSRLFREKSGETFSSFLSRCRIEQAKLLLSTTDLSISEVASSIGYREANSFSRFFKTMSGVSPSGYRASSRRLS